MTEKRFKKISVCGDWGIKDVQNDKVLFFATTDEVNDTFEILNELNNQADAVREELRLCEEENTELQKENEKLKFQNSNLMKEVAEYSREIKRLNMIIKTGENHD